MAEILKNAGLYKILALNVGVEGEHPLKTIEFAGRICHQAQDKITEDSAGEFIKRIMGMGHESVIEHSSISVLFENVSLWFIHELIRHRLASFSEKYEEDEFKAVIPFNKDPDEELVKLEITKMMGLVPQTTNLRISFREWMELNEQMYRGLIKAGWHPEDARQVLPTATKSQIIMTANFREWRHVFGLRCAPNARWEIRRVMVNLLGDVQQRIPVIFDDFKISEDGQSATLKKGE